jgi:hypothetical protein
MALDLLKTVYCPRCDRGFSSALSRARAWAKLVKHVKIAHPEYDIEWTESD